MTPAQVKAIADIDQVEKNLGKKFPQMTFQEFFEELAKVRSK